MIFFVTLWAIAATVAAIVASRSERASLMLLSKKVARLERDINELAEDAMRAHDRATDLVFAAVAAHDMYTFAHPYMSQAAPDWFERDGCPDNYTAEGDQLLQQLSRELKSGRSVDDVWHSLVEKEPTHTY